MAKIRFVLSFLLIFALAYAAVSYNKNNECVDTMFTSVAEGIDPNETCKEDQRCGFWIYDWDYQKNEKFTSDIMTNACLCPDWQKCMVHTHEENYARKFYACRCINVTEPETRDMPDLELANVTTTEPTNETATEPADVFVTEPTKDPVTENTQPQTSDDL